MFLCTGNSCRSQMAEGWARHLHADSIEACRAGTSPHGLNPIAVRVMREVGVDIAAHTSDTIDACDPATRDLVVTVCGHAKETCPVFPGSCRVVQRGFDDPSRLAQSAETEDQALAQYRRVRDEIRAFIQTLPNPLTSAQPVESRE